MAGYMQRFLRSDGVLPALLARAYSWSLRDLFTATVADVDLGRGPLLDVGCGSGEVTARISARDPGRRLVALDLSQAMLRRARCAAPGTAPVAASAERLPFHAGSFGAVVSIASLKFWPDRAAGLDELARVVWPGGRVVVVELDRSASDPELDWLLTGMRGLRLPLAWSRAVVRARILPRAPSAEELAALGRGRLVDAAVEELPGLPFLRLVARRAIDG